MDDDRPPRGHTGAVPIADTPASLTTGWLTRTLRQSGRLDGVSVAEVHQTPVGTGQMCDSIRLTLAYDGPTECPTTMIAKLPAADDTSRATALALGSYENEVRFYQQLAPELPIRTPDVLHADIDVETASFVLLLEDLAPAEPGDQLAGCSPEVAQIAVDELVRLHAPRWNDPSLERIPWLHRDRTMSEQFMVTMLPMFWDGFRDRYATDLTPEVHTAGDDLFGALEPYITSDSRPWSIIHGDYRLDNLLFDPTPGGVPIAVVDWQTCTHGPALQDVAYFLGAGLVAAERREVEEEIVRRYHVDLIAAGVTDYPWDRCWNDYRRGTWAGLVMAVAASMLVARTDRGDQMFIAMATRHSVHALDLDADDTLRS